MFECNLHENKIRITVYWVFSAIAQYFADRKKKQPQKSQSQNICGRVMNWKRRILFLLPFMEQSTNISIPIK